MEVLRVDGAVVAPARAPTGALALATYELTKRFGDFVALDRVSITVQPGTVHALLGENGAGKSTLVKCLVGFHRPDGGSILIEGRETEIASPQRARELGIGMVYQHFTLVPSMTVGENLALARGGLPARIDWRRQRAELDDFLGSVPFRVDPDARVADLSAGEKQKTELLKQLYARNRFLILDEPTSVLTPEEADELLSSVRDLAHGGRMTALLITHKFREVERFADEVTVLRRGQLAGAGRVAEMDADRLATLMVGQSLAGATARRPRPVSSPAATGAPESPSAAGAAGVTTAGASAAPLPLAVRGLVVDNDLGLPAVRGLDLAVAAGSIVGVAGVSGNGQRELVQALTGQRARAAGEVRVFGEPFRASRADYLRHRVAALPEEPLHNACVPGLSVAGNLALRDFDRAPWSVGGWLRPAAFRSAAEQAIEAFRIKTRGPDEPIERLSGGNIQRAVLSRELSREARLLIVMNPVFGLDFQASAEIHQRLRDARDSGCAVLLVSEDLDELLELSDRVLVINGGRIVLESLQPEADRDRIGKAMGGHA
ncbi:MAG: ABC transporter ATP-binding protein [Betaproteobacteria bacterium]|nr:ABC transporter ATP-binding protein [Betaproteobacteria bacterium]